MTTNESAPDLEDHWFTRTKLVSVPLTHAQRMENMFKRVRAYMHVENDLTLAPAWRPPIRRSDASR